MKKLILLIFAFWGALAVKAHCDEGSGIGVTGCYWFDNDISTKHIVENLNGTNTLDISQLSMGAHAVHYQTFDADGVPSSVHTRYFVVDQMPRSALSCQISIDDGAAATCQLSDDDIVIDISDLTVGTHRLSVALFDGYGCYVNTETVEFEIPVPTSTITISTVGEGTYCSDHDLDFTNMKGIRAYVASGYDVEKESILLMRVYKVPAGTGVIVMGKAASYDVPQSKLGFVYSNMLKGVLSKQTVAQGNDGNTHFILKEGEQGTAFYQLTKDTEIPAGSVYLAIPTSVLPESGVVKMEVSGGLKGDVNEDDAVTITDAVSVVNIILNQKPSNE
jgi:hypothetical protein